MIGVPLSFVGSLPFGVGTIATGIARPRLGPPLIALTRSGVAPPNHFRFGFVTVSLPSSPSKKEPEVR
jgi:hypothetical protein